MIHRLHRFNQMVIFLVFLAALTTSFAAPAPCTGCVYLPLIVGPRPIILPNHAAFVSGGYLHVVGEVQNPTGSALRFVRVSVNVFNGAQLVATTFTYPHVRALRPGDKTCFEALMQKPAAWTSYQFEPVNYDTTDEALPTLALLGTTGSADQFGIYHIIGQVRNDSNLKATFVQPIGTLYDAAGMVFDCDYTFVNSTDLDPGQTSAFDLRFYDRDVYNVASYRVQVDGNLP